MENTPDPQQVDPGLVKYLRLLVTVLTTVMIAGFLVIVVLFVTRFSDAFDPDLPDEITLPDGTSPLAYTKGDGWYAVVTQDDQILIYDDDDGALLQTIKINTSQ